VSEASSSMSFGDRIPVGIVIECRQISRGAWTVPQFDVAGVLCGEAMRSARLESSPMGDDGGATRHLWRGLELALYRDAAESYWYNLTSTKPSLFVVCRDEDGVTRPVLVTADGDEGQAHLEMDDLVMSTPLPAEIHTLLEQFVVEHYKPTLRRKRARKRWDEDEGTA